MLMADAGIWPVLFFVAAALISQAAKRRKAAEAQRAREASSPGVADAAPAAAPSGMLAELRKAMEELKRAELEQRGQLPAPQQSDAAAARERQAREYLAKQKARAQQQRHVPVKRPSLALPAAEAVEDATSLESTDYDNEAEQVIESRRAAVERRASRQDVSLEDMSAAQQARRAERQDAPIGSPAEHDAWHHEIGGAPPPPEKKASSRLARFADGTMRGAMVLGEILGPAGGRSRDG